MAGTVSLPRALPPAAAVALLVVAVLGRTIRVEVHGASMAPGLMVGDRVVALRDLPARRGDVVVARDPRQPSRLLVKRVAAVHDDGGVDLAGDAPEASTDSRTFGTIPAASVLARVVWRYWPPARRGRVSGARHRPSR